MNTIEPLTLEYSAQLWKAFSDPVRMRLINLLFQGEICVTDLQQTLGLPQSTVSRHLAYLRHTGVVQASRKGVAIFYQLSEPVTHLHKTLLTSFHKNLATIDTLQADRQRLGEMAKEEK
ncbi:MAG: metalloregulator ArsR/SmtB family transcription factor [Candidatus Peribacteraceae bacterium]|nr:metalloregulator ArsR/SmtB family transcription factor [Candidatus Peribacteraceae bacterium]